jgi:uncharacterized protein YidB (DUF937 family)
MPSLVALLGLLAVAGYQNRDKINEWLNSQKGGAGTPGQPDQPGGLGSVIGDLGTSLGNVVNEGLGGLVDRFKQSGQGDTAEAWVKTGSNPSVAPGDVEKALGADLIDNLARQTGLSREELLDRLAKILPDAVDKYTPDGSIPT